MSGFKNDAYLALQAFVEALGFDVERVTHISVGDDILVTLKSDIATSWPDSSVKVTHAIPFRHSEGGVK